MIIAEEQYRAFISYSHKDKDEAAWLHKTLEGYKVPPRLVGIAGKHGAVGKRLGKIFRDREDLAVSSDLGGKINNALRASQSLIVICSPDSAKSDWVNQEIINFKRLRGADAIIAVIVRGEPFASRTAANAADECFPPALRHTVDAQGHLTEMPAEPIAADFRRGKDGRRHGSLKVIAGLLDVSLDELVRREHQRRQRRLFMVAAASVIASVTLGSLSVVALLARNEAQSQRLIAERARDDTRQKKQQAEGLIEFMLGDLRQKLQPVGRLDVLDAVGERAMAYFASLREEEIDTDSLGRRARALQLIGEIKDLKGDFAGATRAFDESETSTARLVTIEPDSVQRLYEHAQSAYWKGYGRFRQGQFADASAQFMVYHDLAAKLVSLEPKNAKWQEELGSSNVNLGIANLRAGEVTAAVGFFEAARNTYVALSAIDRKYRIFTARTIAWLSDAHSFLGQPRDAQRVEQEELNIYDVLQREDPLNEEVANSRMLALRRMGDYTLQTGQPEPARTHFAQMIEIAQRLTQKDPANIKWARYLARGQLSRASALRESGNAKEAAKELETVQPLLKRLGLTSSPYETWKVELAGRQALLSAGLSMDTGRSSEAQTTLGELDEFMKIAFAKSPEDPSTWQIAMESNLLRGDALRKAGSERDAQAAWQEAIVLARKGSKFVGAPSEIVAVESELRFGRREEAVRAARKLCDNGVRRGNLATLCAGR